MVGYRDQRSAGEGPGSSDGDDLVLIVGLDVPPELNAAAATALLRLILRHAHESRSETNDVADPDPRRSSRQVSEACRGGPAPPEHHSDTDTIEPSEDQEASQG